MLNRSFIATIALAALCLATAGAQAFDESKYPDWRGQWRRAEPGAASVRGSETRLNHRQRSSRLQRQHLQKAFFVITGKTRKFSPV